MSLKIDASIGNEDDYRARATAAEAALLEKDGEIERLQDRADGLEEALYRIQQWSDAYPLTIFPEPDLKKARALLEAGGVTLDSISAHCMRHVVEGVGRIAKAVLPPPPDLTTEAQKGDEP